MKSPLLFVAVVFFTVVGSLRSAPVVTFSGGSGAPLSFSISEPITFTLNRPYFDQYIYVAFSDVYDSPQGLSFLSVGSSTLSLSGSGYSAGPNNGAIAGWNGGSVDAHDITFDFVSAVGVNLPSGTQITLSSGQFTSSQPYNNPLPTASSFNVWVRDNNGGVVMPISNQVVALNAAAVPEPAAFTVLAGIFALGTAGLRRRRV